MLPFEELGQTTLRRSRAVGTEDTCLAGCGCGSSQARLRVGLQAPAAAKGTQRSRGAPQQGAGPGRRGKCQAARQGRPQTAPSPGADCQSPGPAPVAWGLCVVGGGPDERPGRESWKAGGRGWSPGCWLCSSLLLSTLLLLRPGQGFSPTWSLESTPVSPSSSGQHYGVVGVRVASTRFGLSTNCSILLLR